ncbi:hypothetical protein G5V59_17780 [Nocardioides sp. W3-2-3]|nr:hypothetical protein [Nocardioides convexus]
MSRPPARARSFRAQARRAHRRGHRARRRGADDRGAGSSSPAPPGAASTPCWRTAPRP